MADRRGYIMSEMRVDLSLEDNRYHRPNLCGEGSLNKLVTFLSEFQDYVWGFNDER